MDAETAYRRCDEITTREAKNFAYGIKLLPKPKRDAWCAVHAMAGRIDASGDGDLSPADRRIQLGRVRKDVAGLPRHDDDDPVLAALSDVVERFDLPLAEFDRLIDGCQMDVDG